MKNWEWFSDMWLKNSVVREMLKIYEKSPTVMKLKNKLLQEQLQVTLA